MYEESPPLAVVQRFVHLLDTSDADYNEELGILSGTANCNTWSIEAAFCQIHFYINFDWPLCPIMIIVLFNYQWWCVSSDYSFELNRKSFTKIYLTIEVCFSHWCFRGKNRVTAQSVCHTRQALEKILPTLHSTVDKMTSFSRHALKTLVLVQLSIHNIRQNPADFRCYIIVSGLL